MAPWSKAGHDVDVKRRLAPPAYRHRRYCLYYKFLTIWTTKRRRAARLGTSRPLCHGMSADTEFSAAKVPSRQLLISTIKKLMKGCVGDRHIMSEGGSHAHTVLGTMPRCRTFRSDASSMCDRDPVCIASMVGSRHFRLQQYCWTLGRYDEKKPAKPPNGRR
jgi:hypothetical protein